MVSKSKNDWIQNHYRVINSFPFVIGVLYYTEVQNKEKEKPQTRFIHALDLQKFGTAFNEEEQFQKLYQREKSLFFPLEDVFVEENVLFQVFRRLEGYLLTHYIKKHFPLELNEVLRFADQMIEHLLTLYEVDQFTIVHPQNLIISPSKEVRFLYGGPSGIIPKGLMITNDKKAEMLYDSYGMGALIYHMISGKSPMTNGLKIPPISQYLTDCPTELEELVTRSLSFDMEKRPTLEEFQKQLSQLAGSE